MTVIVYATLAGLGCYCQAIDMTKTELNKDRSSYLEVFCKKAALKKLKEHTGKHLW